MTTYYIVAKTAPKLNSGTYVLEARTYAVIGEAESSAQITSNQILIDRFADRAISIHDQFQSDQLYLYKIERDEAPDSSQTLVLRNEDKFTSYYRNDPVEQKHPLKSINSLSIYGLLGFNKETLSSDQLDFLNLLLRHLPSGFLTQDAFAQWRSVNLLRYNTDFIMFLKTNWQLSTLFLTTIYNAVGENAQETGLFVEIFGLNNFRRNVIPENLRRELPLDRQQHFILTLKTFISADFMSKSAAAQWQEIYILRENAQFMSLVSSNPKLSYEILSNLANTAQGNAPEQFYNSRLGQGLITALFLATIIPNEKIMHSKAPEAKSFILILNQFLSKDFLKKDHNAQWREVYALRENRRFLEFLHTNCELSSLFLKTVARAARAEETLSSCRLYSILILNRARTQIIAAEPRIGQLPIAHQQMIVARIFKPRAEPKLEEMPVAGVRTQQIEAALDDKKLAIPEDKFLICPITKELLVQPVKLGVHYFSKVALINTVKSTGRNPLTQAPLTLAEVEKLPIDVAKQQEVETFKVRCAQELNGAPGRAPQWSDRDDDNERNDRNPRADVGPSSGIPQKKN